MGVINKLHNTSESFITAFSELEYAKWRAAQGIKVIKYKGRYWESRNLGFTQPVHLMARLKAEQTGRPSPCCWGYRARLRDEDVAFANASIPLHVLADIKTYDMQSLHPKRRNKIRSCYKRAKIVDIKDPDILIEQGYKVMASQCLRTGYERIPTPGQFRNRIEWYYKSKRFLFLGGYIDGYLAGFVGIYAIEHTAYHSHQVISTEYLKTNLGSALLFKLMQICRRSENIEEVVSGMHARENQGLCYFKEQMGFSVANMPAKFWMMPVLESIVQRYRPHAYYRLRGHD